MPMQMGTLMVSIRAQDFASRTLRRVAGEFAGMSRAQMMAAKQADLTADRLKALDRLTDARQAMRNVRIIQKGVVADKQRVKVAKDLQRALRRVALASQQFDQSRAIKAAKDATTAQNRYNKALAERQRIGRLIDVVGGKGAAQALNRLALAQSALATGGARAATELRNAQKAVDALGKGLRRNSGLMRQFEAATARTAKAWTDLRRARVDEATTRAAAPALRTVPLPMKDAANNLRAARKEASLLGRQMAGLDERARRVGEAVRTMPSHFQRLAMSVNGTANAMSMMNQAWTKAQRNLRDAHANLDDVTRRQMAFDKALADMPLQRLDRLAHALSGVGRTMQLFGAIGTFAFGLAANTFADFNTQVTLAATQTRKLGESSVATAVNATKLQKVIMGLMQEFPASAKDMADAAYTIFSSIDVGFGEGTKLLREFNKVAVAGGVDLTTATNASITVLENFDRQLAETGVTSAKTGKLLNRMFSIVRFGRLNFLQLSQMLGMVVPAATGAGQSFDDVAGALAFLTRTLGMKAGPSLARLLEVIVNPDVQKGMQRAGVRITDLTGALLPLPEIIDRMAAVAGQSKGNLNDFLRIISAYGRGSGRGREWTVQARRALIQLIKGNREYHTVQGQTISNNDEFAKSFEAMSQTLGIRWQVFLNQLKVLVLYIGEKAIPIFLQIGEAVRGWIDRWKQLSDSTRSNIVKWGVILSVGTLLAGVILSISGALLAMAAMLATVGPKLVTVGKSLGTISGLVKGLAGLAAIKIGIDLFKKGDGWNLLGGALAGGGLAMLLGRGGRGTIVGATIGLAATLAFKGDGWQSKIGQILMGAAAGFAFGGPGGALAGAALATIPVLIEVHSSTQSINKAWDEMSRKMDSAAATLSASANISPDVAMKQVASAMLENHRKIMNNPFLKEINDKAGFEAASVFLEAYTRSMARPGGPRDAFDGLAKNAAAGMDKPAAATEGFDQKLGRLMRTAKDWTVIQRAVADGNQNITNTTEKAAIQMGMAFSRGNVANAAKLLNQYTAASTTKVTANNILKLIAAAVKAGDLEKATRLLEEWGQAVEQGRQQMEQHREAVKQWNKDLVQASKDATTEVMGSFRSMYMDLMQQNKEFMGELFQGPWLTGEAFTEAREWGIIPRPEDLLRDMRMQRREFQQVGALMATLVKQGVPRDLLKEIRAGLSPEEAAPFLSQLTKDPKNRAAIIAEFKKRNQAIQNQTKMDFADEIARFKTAGVSMGQAIKEGFESAQVGTWFDTWIKKTFPNVINSAVNQAVTEWKAANPRPIAPVVPGTVRAGTTAGGGGGRRSLYADRAAQSAGGGDAYTTTNSKTQTINIKVDGAISEVGEAVARRIAFATKNAMKGQP